MIFWMRFFNWRFFLRNYALVNYRYFGEVTFFGDMTQWQSEVSQWLVKVTQIRIVIWAIFNQKEKKFVDY